MIAGAGPRSLLAQAGAPTETPVGAPTETPGPPPSDAVFGPLLPSWAEAPATAIVVLLIVVGSLYVSKVVVRLSGRAIARRFRRQSVAQTVLRGLRTGIFLLGLVVAGWFAGLGLPDIVLSVTVFSAVLGFVLAPIIGSVINGLFVLADQPYEVGDMIELVDIDRQGFVEDMTLRYTKILTLDNTFLVVPNSNIRERDVVNYSAEDERTRVRLSVLVTYESDVAEAQECIERAARGCEDVIEGGPDIRIGSGRYSASPRCYVDEFGDDGILLTLRYWVRRPYKLLALRSRVQEAIRDALEEPDVDVEFAYPHRQLVFDDGGAARVRVERDGAEARADTGTAPAPRESGAGPDDADRTVRDRTPRPDRSADGDRDGP